MEPALYGLLGTLVGGTITLVVSWLTNRHQLTVRHLELASERELQVQQTRSREREEKVRRFATFLSANWQAERYAEEVIDELGHRRTDCVERINAIIGSQDYRNLITVLNDGLGWIGVLATRSSLEEAALAVSETYDHLMDNIAGAFACVCRGEEADTDQARKELSLLHKRLRHLSSELRKDLSESAHRPVPLAAPNDCVAGDERPARF